MKTRKSSLRFAKLAVALCLVLPFLAFGLWDALLTVTAPFAPPTGEALPAAGRQNATACLLYGCAHSLNQSLQGSTDGWTLDTATDPAQQQADFLGRVDTLAMGGVLDDFQRAAVRGTVQDTQRFALTRYTLDAGLEQYILMPREPGNAPAGPVRGYPQFHFQAIFTADGVPVYLDLQKKCENAQISSRAMDLRGLLDGVALMEKGLNVQDALDMEITNKTFDPYEQTLIQDTIRGRISKKMKPEDLFEEKCGSCRKEFA